MSALFGDVRYYISLTLGEDRRIQLATVLDADGATAVPVVDASLTHFITVSLPSDDGLEILSPDSHAHLVTPFWVDRARITGNLPSPVYFSPDPALIFSGITATAVDLSPSDLEILSAAISALGGQWRTALTRDVTHLFALSPGSAKYETAMHYRDKTGMCILVPHWFDDSVRLGIRGLPTDEYEWPEPRVFKYGLTSAVTTAGNPDGAGPQNTYKMPKEKKTFYETALATSTNDHNLRRASSRNVWNGLRILLSVSLELSESQRDAHEADIRREGGAVVQLVNLGDSPSKVLAEETRKVDEADILVTRYRSGPAYAKAYRLNKTIGSLAWLWYVRSSGVLSRPTDQLLHYPIPKKPIENFSSHIITITNYTGKDREYLKKLILMMGADFTPSMSGKNTVVIAAYIAGTKTTKARSWSIPIVNHTWLEDCFVKWRSLTPAVEKYIYFPPGIDFSTLLAARGTGQIGFEAGELEALETQELSELVVAGSGAGASAGSSAQDVPPPPGTANSASEVEDVVGVADEVGDVSMGAHMDLDADLGAAADDDVPAVEEPEDWMDVDEERGRSGKARKAQSSTRMRREEPSVLDGSDAGACRTGASASPGGPPRKKLVRRYSRLSGDPPALEADSDEEYSIRERDVLPSRPTSKSQRVKGKQKTADADYEDRPGAERSPKQGRTAKVQRKLRRPIFSPDEDFDIEIAATKSSSLPPRRNIHTPKKVVVQSDTEQEEDADATNHERRTTRATTSRPAPVDPSTPSRSRTSPGKASHTPGRQVSIVLPTVSAVYSSPSKRASASPSKPVTRTDSLRAKAAEAAQNSPPRRSRPSSSVLKPAAEAERPQSPPPPKHRRRASGVAATHEGPPVPGPSRTPSSPPALARTPSKRSAASKATQKLHDVIMPDVMNFQKELRKGAVRAAWEGGRPAADAGADGGELGDGPAQGERAKNKKRASIPAEDGAPAEENEERERKRRRTSAGAQGKAAVQKGGHRRSAKNSQDVEPEEEEPEEQSDGEGSARRKPNSRAGGRSGASLPKRSGQPSRTSAKNVRIMTTQVSVSDDVAKALTRLGCKFTTKPAECTHLVAKNIVRTEKFLCAMAVSPFVVTEKWLVASAATKQILPEGDFALSDAENEKKFGFQLADALRRAKDNGGKLFAGKTFYVTPKITVDVKLLKNVVSAGGGSVVTQTPTVRILNGNENRYVISEKADISIWRSLAQQGHPIFSPELILTGALTQEIDWDSPHNKVKST